MASHFLFMLTLSIGAQFAYIEFDTLARCENRTWSLNKFRV